MMRNVPSLRASALLASIATFAACGSKAATPTQPTPTPPPTQQTRTLDAPAVSAPVNDTQLTDVAVVLKAGNGQTILTSESYTTKAAAENGIASVKTNAPSDARYERKDAKSGQPMFNLKASNGQVIGTSETYSSAAARDAGIDSVKANAPKAATEDKT